MARPRIFVSSTYYDLKHIRSSLENFIDLMGFESILSEKGQIAYSPEIPLDESCYREVGNSDIFIIIIGGRYCSEKSENRDTKDKQFFDRYDSITKQEYKSAIERDVPSYILIEKSVYSEFEIFLKNKDNESINYVHVDSVNVFHLIENVLSQPRNNPVNHTDETGYFWNIVAGTVIGAAIGAILLYRGSAKQVEATNKVEEKKLQANIVTTERLRWLQELRLKSSEFYANLDMHYNLLKRPINPQQDPNFQIQLDEISKKAMIQCNQIK